MTPAQNKKVPDPFSPLFPRGLQSRVTDRKPLRENAMMAKLVFSICLVLMCSVACCRSQGVRTTTRPALPEPALPEDVRDAFRAGNVRGAIQLIKDKYLSKDTYFALEDAAFSKEPREAQCAIITLGRLPNRGQWQALRKVAAEATPEALRYEAMYGLAILRDHAAVPFLLEKLRDGTEFERASARLALGYLKDPPHDKQPLSVTGLLVPPDSMRKSYRAIYSEYPTDEQALAEYSRWWADAREKLLSERHLVDDYWRDNPSSKEVMKEDAQLEKLGETERTKDAP